MLEVLFVCTGNICRSPLAEVFLQDRTRALPGEPVRVSSAGTWGRRGNPAMPESVAVAGERGLDLGKHGARPLTGELIERSDLILGMTTEHTEEVALLVPDAAPRTFTLKELAGLLGDLEPLADTADGAAVRRRITEADELRRAAAAPFDVDVSDPLGFGIETYRAIAWEIEEAVGVLLRGLFGIVQRSEARKDT